MTEEKLCDGCIHQPEKDGTYPETCTSCSRWYGDNYEKKDEPIYYYQWENLCDGVISTSNHCSDERAERQFTNPGWIKIESSKRTWDEE